MLHVGSMYYQDLWSYSSTNLWTQLFPTNGQPQPVGRKYHSGGAIYSSTNISTILFFYGGMDSNNMVLNTWLAVDLGDNFVTLATLPRVAALPRAWPPIHVTGHFQINFNVTQLVNYNQQDVHLSLHAPNSLIPMLGWGVPVLREPMQTTSIL